MSPRAAVAASAVHKRFGSVRAVAGIDLEVPPGVCFGLIGENGAGKTTFIKMVLGITRPDQGDLRVFGRSPEDVAVRREVGYLPERLDIPGSFSATRFLASVGRLRRLSADEIRRETPRVLELVDLDRAAWNRRSAGYSKGMRQRTGLAAALLGGPKLLVLDEPTDGIDPLGRARIRAVLRETCAEGTTVFLNSHLLAESEKLCDHVAVLARGRVVKTGALDDLKRMDAVRARFLKREGDVEIAARHGFVHAGDLDETRVYRCEGSGPEAVSRSVRGALQDGLILVELAPELKDLETILKESVRVGS